LYALRIILLTYINDRCHDSKKRGCRGSSISPYLIGHPRDFRIDRTALRVRTLTHGEKREPPLFTDKVGAREGDGILELVRHIVQDESRRLIGRAEFLGSPPGADATGKRRIDGDRDDGEYGQAHQELDEGEAVPPSSRSRHLTPVSSTSRRRSRAAAPAEPMKP